MNLRTILPVLAFWILNSIAAPAKLNVVATLPDFGAIAEAIGRDKINVTSIARGTEDPHFVDARPSFIKLLNKADVLLEGGAELEIGWLPPLVNNSRNSKILPGAPGHVVLSRHIQLLELPTGPIDRSMGDVHPAGNPHYWLDPENGKIIASDIAEAFARLDAPNAAFYRANLKDFNSQLEQKVAIWTKTMAPYKGTRIVTYHKSYEYFAQRFGLEIAGQLEPKPGLEPSPTHINSLIPMAKEQKVKLVVIEPNRPRKTPQYVAQAIGAKLIIAPGMVGGNEKIKTYFDLFDYDIGEILSGLKAE
ncbi:MAG: transporter substrate-binding protein [Verrucomicrobiales bacterium]|nr:transporter substrate-binding protein [Verrucomicrobiales bacterium]